MCEHESNISSSVFESHGRSYFLFSLSKFTSQRKKGRGGERDGSPGAPPTLHPTRPHPGRVAPVIIGCPVHVHDVAHSVMQNSTDTKTKLVLLQRSNRDEVRNIFKIRGVRSGDAPVFGFQCRRLVLLCLPALPVLFSVPIARLLLCSAVNRWMET